MKKEGRSKKKLILISLLILICALMPGCNQAEESEAGEGQQTEEANQPNVDDYDAYIQAALNKVTQSSVKEEPKEEDTRQVQVTRGVPLLTVQPDSYYVDAGDDSDFISGAEAPDAQNVPNVQPDEGLTGGVTPDTFDVGTCCIYIDGESDSGYAGDLITELNNIRTNMGYQPFNENTSLSECADRRAREITCYLNHTRPNQKPFYSLAPEYFKAEMLAIDGANALDTIRAWIRDENSRSILFNTKYTSVGAACFKCNGLNCVVLAFGY